MLALMLALESVVLRLRVPHIYYMHQKVQNNKGSRPFEDKFFRDAGRATAQRHRYNATGSHYIGKARSVGTHEGFLGA
jgi:hypothetical protein